MKPKQETLEEASEKYAKQFDYAEDSSPQLDFIEGAKWQQERMYSEEEVLEIIRQYALEEHLITSSKPDKWFEQFKKK
jgi:hypothetical protein